MLAPEMIDKTVRYKWWIRRQRAAWGYYWSLECGAWGTGHGMLICRLSFAAILYALHVEMRKYEKAT